MSTFLARFVPLPANTLAMYNDAAKGFVCTHGCIAVFTNGKPARGHEPDEDEDADGD